MYLLKLLNFKSTNIVSYHMATTTYESNLSTQLQK